MYLQCEGLPYHQVMGQWQDTRLQWGAVCISAQELGTQPHPQQSGHSQQASSAVRLLATVQRQQQNRQRCCSMGLVRAAVDSQDGNGSFVQEPVWAVCWQGCFWRGAGLK